MGARHKRSVPGLGSPWSNLVMPAALKELTRHKTASTQGSQENSEKFRDK